MKIYYCLSYIMFFSIFSFAQTKEKRSILIFSINFYTTTIISIPCESFTSQFKDIIKITEVNSEDSISKLDEFIDNVLISKKRNASVNTRAKLIYKNKNGNKLNICTDKFNILVDGVLIKKNKLFIKFILSLIPEEQLKFHYPERVKNKVLLSN